MYGGGAEYTRRSRHGSSLPPYFTGRGSERGAAAYSSAAAGGSPLPARGARHVGGTMSKRGDLLVAVDIGGTFTDVVVRGAGAPTRIMKIPSTRKDPSIAVLQALARMEADWDLRPQQVTRFVHGTTVATNAVLERKGACVGLITT